MMYKKVYEILIEIFKINTKLFYIYNNISK